MNFTFAFEVSTGVFLAAIAFRLFADVDFLRSMRIALGEYAGSEGLKSLKRKIIILLFLLFTVNTIGLIFFVMRPFVSSWLFNLASNILTVTNAFTFFLIGRIMFAILTNKYPKATPADVKNTKAIKEMKQDVKKTAKTVEVSAKDIKEVKTDVKIIKKDKKLDK